MLPTRLPIVGFASSRGGDRLRDRERSRGGDLDVRFEGERLRERPRGGGAGDSADGRAGDRSRGGGGDLDLRFAGERLRGGDLDLRFEGAATAAAAAAGDWRGGERLRERERERDRDLEPGDEDRLREEELRERERERERELDRDFEPEDDDEDDDGEALLLRRLFFFLDCFVLPPPSLTAFFVFFGCFCFFTGCGFLFFLLFFRDGEAGAAVAENRPSVRPASSRWATMSPSEASPSRRIERQSWANSSAGGACMSTHRCIREHAWVTRDELKEQSKRIC